MGLQCGVVRGFRSVKERRGAPGTKRPSPRYLRAARRVGLRAQGCTVRSNTGCSSAEVRLRGFWTCKGWFRRQACSYYTGSPSSYLLAKDRTRNMQSYTCRCSLCLYLQTTMCKTAFCSIIFMSVVQKSSVWSATPESCNSLVTDFNSHYPTRLDDQLFSTSHYPGLILRFNPLLFVIQNG